MSEIGRAESAGERRARRLRLLILAGIALQALIYLCLFVFIDRHANPMGDGLEWVAIVPATVILAAGMIPSIGLCFSRRLLPAGVLVAGAGILMNATFLLQIVRELNHWQ